MLHILIMLSALVGFTVPATAQTRPLPQGEVRANGDITFGNSFKLGRREGNKTTLTPDALQILGPGSVGDGSGFDVTAPLGGGQPYSLAERARDEVNVMAFIPRNLRDAVRNGTNTSDLTSYVRAAAATGKTIRFPDGAYRLCDSINVKSTQRFVGNGVGKTRFDITNCFNLSAPGVFNFEPGDSSGIDGMEIRFAQPNAPAGRAGLIKYPPALEFSPATRMKVGTLRISGAWVGMRAVGNAGGLSADLLEIGAYNQGIILDGLLDFAHITTLHCWQFGVDTAQQASIYYDKSTNCAEFGRVDGLDIKTLNTFATTVRGNANGNTGAARQIAMMQLDGDGARFDNLAGDFEIGTFSSTKGTSPDPNATFWNQGGTVKVNMMRLWGATSGIYVLNSGGTLVINGGSFEHQGDTPALQVLNGTVLISNVKLTPQNASTRTQPYIMVRPNGCLVAKNNSAVTNGVGTLIFVETDKACHTVSGNDFNDWGYVVPYGAVLGEYGPNKVAPFPWNPTPVFDGGNGTFAVTSYGLRQGTYSYGAGKIDYNFRVHFSHDAYSGAAGNFKLDGLPFYSRRIDQMPGAFSEFNGFSMSAGQTWAAPVVSANPASQGIYATQLGGAGPAAINASNVPSATGTRFLSGSGSIPLR